MQATYVFNTILFYFILILTLIRLRDQNLHIQATFMLNTIYLFIYFILTLIKFKD